MVDAEQFNLLVQQVCGLAEAMQAMHRQTPALVRPAQDSLEPRGSIWKRPTWATRPLIPEKEKQRIEGSCSDHDSIQGKASHPFHQKTLKINDREDLLDQRLLEMNQRIEELRHTPSSHGNNICTDLPFSQRIIQEPIPPNFKLPQFESYDGITDPIDHLRPSG
ncbi:hypothetical protein COCNU_06G012700 [Cocos nucifera]|uniref:Uncharacterized protein n=1 Tax=Cocos nucifera TaxID=13894 RepID=A0A8K0IC01_COCNU|nr:hypothetical protein COCNU_06G012700 [Cocos nucifera]